MITYRVDVSITLDDDEETWVPLGTRDSLFFAVKLVTAAEAHKAQRVRIVRLEETVLDL